MGSIGIHAYTLSPATPLVFTGEAFTVCVWGGGCVCACATEGEICVTEDCAWEGGERGGESERESNRKSDRENERKSKRESKRERERVTTRVQTSEKV